MTTTRLAWTGHGYVYDEATYEAFVAWAEDQEDLPEDENEAMDAFEAQS